MKNSSQDDNKQLLGTHDDQTNNADGRGSTSANPDTVQYPGALDRDRAIGRSRVGNIDRFRLSQDFSSAAREKQVLTSVLVRKPHKQEYIRSSAALTFQTRTFTFEETGRIYLVEPAFERSFPAPLRPTMLVGCINRSEPTPMFFFCPIYLASDNESWNSWPQSLHAALILAQSEWVRVASDQSAKRYQAFVAVSRLKEPVWPNEALEDLLDLAFGDSVVTGPEHTVVKKLRGEE